MNSFSDSDRIAAFSTDLHLAHWSQRLCYYAMWLYGVVQMGIQQCPYWQSEASLLSALFIPFTAPHALSARR